MCCGCSCFTSPIPRAQQFAELVWGDRPGKPEDMQSLKEAHLGWLQGMENGEHLTLDPQEAQATSIKGSSG